MGTCHRPLSADRGPPFHDFGRRRKNRVGSYGCSEHSQRRSGQQSDGGPLRAATFSQAVTMNQIIALIVTATMTVGIDVTVAHGQAPPATPAAAAHEPASSSAMA